MLEKNNIYSLKEQRRLREDLLFNIHPSERTLFFWNRKPQKSEFWIFVTFLRIESRNKRIDNSFKRKTHRELNNINNKPSRKRFFFPFLNNILKKKKKWFLDWIFPNEMFFFFFASSPSTFWKFTLRRTPVYKQNIWRVHNFRIAGFWNSREIHGSKTLVNSLFKNSLNARMAKFLILKRNKKKLRSSPRVERIFFFFFLI